LFLGQAIGLGTRDALVKLFASAAADDDVGEDDTGQFAWQLFVFVRVTPDRNDGEHVLTVLQRQHSEMGNTD
jgi:hypothetical protein